MVQVIQFITLGISILSSTASSDDDQDIPRSFLSGFVDHQGLQQYAPAEWGWSCIQYIDAADTNVFHREDSFMAHWQGCVLCNDAGSWKDDCMKISKTGVRTGFQDDFSGFGVIRENLGRLPNMDMPKLLNYVAFDWILMNSKTDNVMYCRQENRLLDTPNYLSLRGFVLTFHAYQKSFSFSNVNFGEILILFEEPIKGCKPNVEYELRVNIGGSTDTAKGLRNGERTPATSCYSSVPAFTVTCKYKDKSLICPATDLLRSIEIVLRDEYMNIVVDLDTTCGKPEETPITVPNLDRVEIIYLKPYVSNYFRRYQTNPKSFILKFPRCWFTGNDTDYDFAGSWMGTRESEVIVENSWTYGTISEEQCVQMGGSPVNETTFRQYYKCDDDQSLAHCGFEDEIQYNIIDMKDIALYPHARRAYSETGNEPY